MAEEVDAALRRLEKGEVPTKAVEALKARLRERCATLQLGPADLWQAAGATGWARLSLLSGDWRSARSTLWLQAEAAQNLERAMVRAKLPVSAFSPVAACRFFLAETYRREYEDAGSPAAAQEAFRHYANVFVKYADGPWSAPAAERMAAIRRALEEREYGVRVELGRWREPFFRGRLRAAARLRAEGRNEEATSALLTLANRFPEAADVPLALHDLAAGFARAERFDEVRATAEYLCERFAGRTNAAAAAAGIGRLLWEAGEESAALAVFRRQLAAFPEYAARPAVLTFVAHRAFDAGNREEAGRRFAELEALLRERGESGEAPISAAWFTARCADDPAAYGRFAETFPDSPRAPEALLEKARKETAANALAAAERTTEELRRRYPESESARSAAGTLAAAAARAGRREVAERAVAALPEGEKGAEARLAAGEALLEAEAFELAERAFSGVPADGGSERAERALLGLARAQCGAGRAEQGARTLARWSAAFPNSASRREGMRLRALALARAGRTNEALRVCGEVADDPDAALEMAALWPNPTQRLAAYRRIVLLENPKRKGGRARLAEALTKSIPLCLELGRYRLALEQCDRFERAFPRDARRAEMRKYREEARRALE